MDMINAGAFQSFHCRITHAFSPRAGASHPHVSIPSIDIWEIYDDIFCSSSSCWWLSCWTNFNSPLLTAYMQNMLYPVMAKCSSCLFKQRRCLHLTWNVSQAQVRLLMQPSVYYLPTLPTECDYVRGRHALDRSQLVFLFCIHLYL